jgi:Flp pilus assembly protein TadG
MTGRFLARHRAVTGRLDEGAVAIVVALLTVVLVGMAAFATDFGLAYSRQRQLQTAADGASLAAAKTFADAATPGLTCSTVVASASGSAVTVARSYHALNAPADAALATGAAPSGWSGDAGVAYRCNPAGNVEVRVTNTGTSPAFFGSVFGVSDIDLGRSATAAMGPATAVTGLRPFAVCATAANQLLANNTANPGAAQLVSFDKVFSGTTSTATPCGSSPGNWGTLDYDGGSNPVGDTTLWTDVGFNAQIDLGSDLQITFPGDPGFPSANSGNCTTGDGCVHTVNLSGALNDIINRPSVLPVFDVVTGSGNNASYRVVGFIGVKLCGWKIGNQSGTGPNTFYNLPACYDSSANVSLPTGNGSSSNAFQVRVDGFIPIGQLSQFCGLSGNPSVQCSNSPRVTQLVN